MPQVIVPIWWWQQHHCCNGLDVESPKYDPTGLTFTRLLFSRCVWLSRRMPFQQADAGLLHSCSLSRVLASTSTNNSALCHLACLCYVFGSLYLSDTLHLWETLIVGKCLFSSHFVTPSSIHRDCVKSGSLVKMGCWVNLVRWYWYKGLGPPTPLTKSRKGW